MNAVCDNVSRDKKRVDIASGSFGEGLQMLGSDLDIMWVLQFIEVHDTTTSKVVNHIKPYLSLTTDDTKPGFAMLRLVSSPYSGILKICEQFKRDFYLSNVLFKTIFLSEDAQLVHGPCISDVNGLVDIAVCLHNKSWIQLASQWNTRSNYSWPKKNIKQMIINHGVLFVPIGDKGSPHEDLEWRISFSVGERFLIYTFSHTQLLCYALMKILLKDAIDTDNKCKDLLCSYYMKTIIFWISEELQPSVWTPADLIPCFMRCFSRLIYCVQYQVCPHYFIPENNLFENKIEGLARDNLIDKLRMLFSYGWRCILFSKQISNNLVLPYNVQRNQSYLNYDDINKFLKSKLFFRVSALGVEHNDVSRVVYDLISCT
ncbi:Hypothetical predicted protein [Mytilus galloprovincialis]|uniref:Mab-21-like HhH/H2TH-like domain-containing protein n=1 Tax=Mytilus galloprovincialis TaxID=29158 RepID=A0A8B6H587_MYTGA|nr:Hypothetical predicted protein [Mytilus galloprovincialis]